MIKRESSFTLMELIIVIVIIGILVGIMVPTYTKAQENAIDKQAKTILSIIYAAEINYLRETGSFYPDPNSGIQTSLAAINSALGLELADNGNWEYKIGTTSVETWPNPYGAPAYLQTLRAAMCRNKGGISRSWYINLKSDNPDDAVTAIPSRTEDWYSN